MKKSLWAMIMLITMIFASCQSEDNNVQTSTQPERNLHANHFYGVKSIPEGTIQTKGVAQRDKLWSNGTIITVKLLNDPYGMADKVKTYVAEWEKYANITFKFVESTETALVRIGFDWNDNKWVTWSYTGTDCKYIRNQSEPTLNFAFWDSSLESERKADVLRAFGQVLGLELEHRHLSFDAGWTSRIQQYWTGEITDIPWDELTEYVFSPLSTLNLIQTKEYDENSIMIWPFSSRYATNTARDYNYQLSEQDIEFIKQLYPKEDSFTLKIRPNEKLDSLDKQSYPLIFSAVHPSTIIVDYGDGKSDTVSTSENSINHFYLKHLYDKGQVYTIKVNGDIDKIKMLELSSRIYIEEDYKDRIEYIIQDLDITGLSNLKTLYIVNSWSVDGSSLDIDFSKATALYDLLLIDCRNIYNLDLSACKSLKQIGMKNIPVTENKELITQFANNLPDNGGGCISFNSYGEYFISNQVHNELLLLFDKIANPKNWGGCM